MALAKVLARRLMVAVAVVAAGCAASGLSYATASLAFDLGSFVGSR